MEKILYIAVIISILTFNLWEFLPEGAFYIGMSLFILLLSVYIYLKNKKSFICWLLLMLSINNLADELFFDATKLQLNELIFALSLPVVWVIKILRNDDKDTRE